MQLKTTTAEQTGPRNEPPAVDVRGITDQLRGNSPDEVLGSVKQASLTQGIALASVLTLVLMALLTIGPFFLGSRTKKKQGAKPAAAAAAQNNEPTPAAAQDAAEGTDAASEGSAATANVAGGTPKVNAKVLKKLGVDDVKKSDPKKNPLEDSVENLLKDIK